MTFDAIIENGLYFDGTGAEPAIRHLGIKDGRVSAISVDPLDSVGCATVIDATDRWVTPGFIETHSHYDAEVLASPALSESVRHGVTTVTIGLCSLSTIVASPDDCSDIFTRVEAVPERAVKPILRREKTWSEPAQFVEHLRSLPLGPNVAGYLGHSDLRAGVMGLERSTSKARPTRRELETMKSLLHKALDAGLLGLSTMTTKLDRVDGDVAWERPLPSTFARWSEYRGLHRILRKRDAILQSAPDAVGRINLVLFLATAVGRFRRPIRMTLLTALDLKSNPFLPRITMAVGWFTNRVLGGNMRWQTLPGPFIFEGTGVDCIFFNELSSGAALRKLRSVEDQRSLIADPAYREAFKKGLRNIMTKGLWNRDFSEVEIVACPDGSVVGSNLVAIGAARGIDPLDAWFEMYLEHGDHLRWRIPLTSRRPNVIRKMVSDPSLHVGFADSGAHITNLANYNFPLRFLQDALAYEGNGKPGLTPAQAVHRLTGELADWYGIDAGHIRPGDRADVVVLDPSSLGDDLATPFWERCDAFEMDRLVNRNDHIIDAVFINGQVAYEQALGVRAELGKSHDFGTFLARSAPR